MFPVNSEFRLNVEVTLSPPNFTTMPPSLSLLAATFLVVASMLGSGILTTSGAILNLVKSPDAAMTVWLIAGAHAVLGAYCYGIIARRMPENGGEASILRNFLTPALGEIAGWVSFIVGFAASNAASAIGFAAYLQKAAPGLGVTGKWAGLSSILLVTLLHSISGPVGIRIQTGLAMVKFSLLSGLTVWGLTQITTLAPSTTPAMAAAPFGSPWGLAIMFSMFAYLGWSAAIYSAAETRDAPRNVPRAMLLGTLIVLTLYLGVNLALLRHIPLSELAGEKAVLELLVHKLFGQQAAQWFAAIVAFALLSSLGASAFLGPRVLDTMLNWYRVKRPEADRQQTSLANRRVPASLVWLQAALSIAMILSGTFEQILTVTGFLLGIFPMLAVLSLYTAKANSPLKVSKFAKCLAAPVFIGGSLLILVLGAKESPKEMATASVVILLIFLMRRKSQSPPLSPLPESSHPPSDLHAL